MDVCEDCKDKVGASLKSSKPHRKGKCNRCGKEDWCFKVARETKELVVKGCEHIKAVQKDLKPVWGWKDDTSLLKYHDLVLGQPHSWSKHHGSHCPTCGESIKFGLKVIYDWPIGKESLKPFLKQSSD